jgi:hypothetical protein
MKTQAHLRFRRTIILTVATAALAAPVAATAYPVIPDDPAQIEAVGHAWMAKHNQKIIRIKRVAKPSNVILRNDIGHFGRTP